MTCPSRELTILIRSRQDSAAKMQNLAYKNTDHNSCNIQESEELRLPIDMQELSGAAQQARGGGSLAKAEVMLEMRAQLSTSMPWAPMVRLYPAVVHALHTISDRRGAQRRLLSAESASSGYACIVA